MTLTATAEALTVGVRCGLDPSTMTDVLDASTGGSWISRTHIRQRVISRRFDDPFKLELMLKDIGIALAVAREAGIQMPLCEARSSAVAGRRSHAGPGRQRQRVGALDRAARRRRDRLRRQATTGFVTGRGAHDARFTTEGQ